MDRYREEINRYLNSELILEELFKTLPEDRERLFENCVIEMISKGSDIEKDACDILHNLEVQEEIAYKAFYTLCSLYRRRKDITVYGEIFRRYGRRFENMDTYGYLKSMYLVQTGKIEKMRQALVLCSKSYEKVAKNVGIKHCYSEIVAEVFEEKLFDIKKENDYKLFNTAMDAIEEIINYNEEKYAKFHCTYGRLLALDGNYISAKIEIKKAIDIEKSDRPDYALRVGEYMKHLMSITSLEQMSKLEDNLVKCNNEINNFNNKIDDTLSKNIEFLGFFAALVSFVIASVQMLSKQDFNEALRLIIALGGIQMLVIGSFGIILSGKKGIKRSVVVFLMAIITIIIGVKVI